MSKAPSNSPGGGEPGVKDKRKEKRNIHYTKVSPTAGRSFEGLWKAATESLRDE